MDTLASPDVHFLGRDEGRVAYTVEGSGPLVVAVTGMGDLRSSYRELTGPLLDAGYRVALMDLRGHGSSDTTFHTHGDVATGEDILALIDALGGPAMVLGNSMGAASAAWAAAERPEPIAGLVLYGPLLREAKSTPLGRTFTRLLYRVALSKPWGAAFWAGYYRSINEGRKAPWLDQHLRDIRANLSERGRLRSLRELALQLDHSVVEARLAKSVPRCVPSSATVTRTSKIPSRRMSGSTGSAATPRSCRMPATTRTRNDPTSSCRRPSRSWPVTATRRPSCGSPMPRVGLSRAALVSAAIELIDDGRPATLSELTLAGLASRVGVAVPSLYKHVASLADLRREVAIASVNELRGIIAAATVGLAGAEAVAAMAQAVRSFAHEHPGRYAATQAAGDPGDLSDDRLTEAGVQTVAVIASILQGFDLPESRTVDAIRILRSAVHGFVLLELEGGFGLPDDRERSFALLVKTVTAGITQLGVGSAGHNRPRSSS